MREPNMSIYISADYWKAFAAQAAKEAERLANETNKLIARLEAQDRERAEEMARIQAANKRLAEGKGNIIAIDFKGRHFIG